MSFCKHRVPVGGQTCPYCADPFTVNRLLRPLVTVLLFVALWSLVDDLLPTPPWLRKILNEWGPFAMLGGAILVFVAISSELAEFRQRRARWRDAVAPCDHGVIGANGERSLCPECTTAIEHRREVLRVAFARVATLQSLTPMGFQRLVWRMYRKLGYDVKETPQGPDGGVDGFLEKDGKRFVLQCKRYRSDVGEPVLRDLFGTLHHHQADGAILVTTGNVSAKAVTFARGKSLLLVDEAELLRLLGVAELDPLEYPEQWVVPED